MFAAAGAVTPAMAGLAVLQSAVGVVFLGAAVTKLATGSSVRPFLEALALPPSISRPLAALTPSLEALFGLLLILGAGVWAAAGATVLATGFLLTLTVARWSGVTVGCHCFGSLDAGTHPVVGIARAGGLAAACLVLLLAGAPAAALEPATLVLGTVAAAEYVAAFALAGRLVAMAGYRQRFRDGTARAVAAQHAHAIREA